MNNLRYDWDFDDWRNLYCGFNYNRHFNYCLNIRYNYLLRLFFSNNRDMNNKLSLLEFFIVEDYFYSIQQFPVVQVILYPNHQLFGSFGYGDFTFSRSSKGAYSCMIIFGQGRQKRGVGIIVCYLRKKKSASQMGLVRCVFCNDGFIVLEELLVLFFLVYYVVFVFDFGDLLGFEVLPLLERLYVCDLLVKVSNFFTY